MNHKRLRCGKCGEVIMYHEEVILDFLNTVIHHKCCSSFMDIKDTGTFNDIVNKYSFFDQFRITGYIQRVVFWKDSVD